MQVLIQWPTCRQHLLLTPQCCALSREKGGKCRNSVSAVQCGEPEFSEISSLPWIHGIASYFPIFSHF